MPHAMETCYGSRLHCVIHGEDESDGFLACGECWHSFATEADLLAAHNAVVIEHGGGPLAVTAADVFCCPFCVHNF